MTSLAPVLSAADLPLAELCAARLDGELYAVDDCYSPVDLVEGVWARAAAIRAQWPQRVIAERFTAAWIWGVAGTPPSRHDLCSTTTARVRSTLLPLRANLREVVIDADDLLEVARMPVTTPLRTALDIARHSNFFDDDIARVLAALLTLDGIRFDECVESLERRRNLPGKVRAKARLRYAFELFATAEKPGAFGTVESEEEWRVSRAQG